MSYIGRKINIGLALETTRGTARTATMWMRKTNCSFEPKITKVVDEGSLGVIHDAACSTVANERAEGDLETNLSLNIIGLILAGVLGSDPTTTTVTTGVYQHVFPRTNTNQHKSLSITTADDIQDYIYPLGMVNSFEMEAQINNYITSVISLLSKKGQTTTANPSYIEDCPFTSRYMSIYIADTVEDLDDANKANLTSFTMTINKNLEQEFAIGEIDPKEISNKQFSIEGSLAYNHNNDTYRNMVLSNAFKAMKVEIEDSSVDIGGENHPKLTFILPRISMTEISRDQSNDSLVNETVSFKGMFDLSSGVPIQATLINKQSSY